MADETALTVPEREIPPILFGRTPEELTRAHQDLGVWADRKLAELDREARDLTESLNVASTGGLKTDAIDRALARTERRLTFYRKIKKALDAGYMVVPNFPMDMIAVRTSAKSARGGLRRNFGYAPSDHYPQPAQQRLEAGEGRYVAGTALVERFTQQERRKPEAAPETCYYVKPGDLDDDIEVPMALAVPAVMSATSRALQEKIFDEIGIARDRTVGGDPMILGRLLNPKHKWATPVTFFVAWFFDPSRI